MMARAATTNPGGARLWLPVACIGLALALVAMAAGSLLKALSAPSLDEVIDTAPQDRERADRFSQAFDSYLAQTQGRSLFMVPPRPAAPIVDRPSPPATEPAKPSRYGGPAILGTVNGVVWFADGRRLKIGDTSDAQLAVVRVDGPWIVVVRWEGVEFDVPLFPHGAVVVKEPAPAAPEPPMPPTADESGQGTLTATDGSVPGAGGADAPAPPQSPEGSS